MRSRSVESSDSLAARFSAKSFAIKFLTAFFVGKVSGYFIPMTNEYRSGYLMVLGFCAYPVLGMLEVKVKGAIASTASVDHARTVELSPEAGRNVLDIRAGITADQSALKALQQYVRDVCLKQSVKESLQQSAPNAASSTLS